MASLLHACFSFKVWVVDWQGVSLCVEHPVIQRQHVIFTEQKIEVPAAIRARGRRWTQRQIKRSSGGTLSMRKRARMRWGCCSQSVVTAFLTAHFIPLLKAAIPGGSTAQWCEHLCSATPQTLPQATQRQICSKGTANPRPSQSSPLCRAPTWLRGQLPLKPSQLPTPFRMARMAGRVL